MDGQRFDLLTRSFVRTVSRRFTLRALGAGLCAAVAGRTAGPAVAQVETAACVRPGKSCQGGKKCCGQARCRGNRCRCPGKTKPCGTDCIRPNQCCRHRDCPANVRCRRNHQCGCAKSQRRCGKRCLARTACCTSKHCPPGQVCSNKNRCVAQSCEENGDCARGVCTCAIPGAPPTPDAGQCQRPTFVQTFAANANGWYASAYDLASGAPTDWAPPETDDTITVAGGVARLAVINPQTDRIAATTLGGFSPDFPADGFDVSLDIYLDPATVPPNVSFHRFSYGALINQSAACQSDVGSFFDAGGTNDEYCVAVVEGGDFANPCRDGALRVLAAAWYRFVSQFRNVGGTLEITTSFQLGDLPIRSNTVSSGSITDFGGNSFAGFIVNDFDGLRIRNSRRINR